MNRKTLFTTLIFALAFVLVGVGSASAQTQLLKIEQDIPLAATLNNPCTAANELITFTGWTHLNQEVWLMPGGTTRLVVSDSTTLQGKDSLLPLISSPTYSASGTDSVDVEFSPGAASIYNYKKVVSSSGSQDNFYTVVALDFDPASLRINVSVTAECADGSPTSTP
jgi:hypothetical protein